jgi:hypothetical protein
VTDPALAILAHVKARLEAEPAPWAELALRAVVEVEGEIRADGEAHTLS